jgi:hypothetical protein
VCWPVLATAFAHVALFVFLRDVWIRTQRAAVASRRATNLANSHPSPCVRKLSLFVILPVRSPPSILPGEGGEGGGGAKSYDGEKAWSSLNHSVLSGFVPLGFAFFLSQPPLSPL